MDSSCSSGRVKSSTRPDKMVGNAYPSSPRKRLAEVMVLEEEQGVKRTRSDCVPQVGNFDASVTSLNSSKEKSFVASDGDHHTILTRLAQARAELEKKQQSMYVIVMQHS